MKPNIRSLTFAVAIFASVVISGCNRQDAPALQSGKPCTILFRRDALGAGAPLPGAESSISANFKRSTSDWIVIEGKGGREIFIPQAVILLIEQ